MPGSTREGEGSDGERQTRSAPPSARADTIGRGRKRNRTRHLKPRAGLDVLGSNTSKPKQVPKLA